ncbi:MAG TPA: hypothetical protein PL131_13975 [Methylotenera sp.]|nr:hypothetical protein [Methylotenera sp.]
MKNTTSNSTDIKFAEFIALQLEVTIPTLAKNKKYYAKDLMGVDVWELLTKGEQIQVGEEMYAMVKKGLLPITDAGRSTSNWRQYWIN